MMAFAIYRGWIIHRVKPGVLCATRDGQESISGRLWDVLELVDEIEGEAE